MEHLLAAENLPFSVALALMCLIALLESIGVVLGLAPSEFVDSVLPDFDAPDLDGPDIELPDAGANVALGTDLDVPAMETGGFFTKLLGWLSFGKVPALIWLILFLASFGLSGLIAQAMAKGILGIYLPSFVATIPALMIGAPVTGQLGKVLAHILPKDESEAVSRDAFVGRVAQIIRGTASVGNPAEAKLTDKFNLTHYVLVVPDIETQSFEAGDDVLIVRKDRNVFRVIESQSLALTS